MEDANAIHQGMVESIETLLKYTDFDKIVAALDIDESSRADARRLWAFIDQQTDSIFENFYQKWLTIDITGVYKFRTDEITALKEKQRRHWRSYFPGGWIPLTSRRHYASEWRTETRKSLRSFI